jgi:hypothetical protein
VLPSASCSPRLTYGHRPKPCHHVVELKPELPFIRTHELHLSPSCSASHVRGVVRSTRFRSIHAVVTVTARAHPASCRAARPQSVSQPTRRPLHDNAHTPVGVRYSRTQHIAVGAPRDQMSTAASAWPLALLAGAGRGRMQASVSPLQIPQLSPVHCRNPDLASA